MHILKRIVIENYRSCLRTRIDLHPELSVLIGPNGTGKTNILQAITLLGKLAQPPEHRGPLSRKATTTSRIAARFESRRGTARLSAQIAVYTGESNNDVMLRASERWLARNRKGERFSTRAPLAAIAAFLPGKAQHYTVFKVGDKLFWPGVGFLPQEIPTWARATLSGVHRLCSRIRYYGASQFTNPGTCPTSFEIGIEGKQRTIHRLRGHARILYAMYSAQKTRPNRDYQRFIDIVGPNGLRLIDDLTFNEVQSSSMEYSVRVGGKIERRRRRNLLVIPQFRIGRQTLSPNQLSEGTFKTLALLFHLMTEDSEALLIEEPEVCIHHGLLSSVLEIVKSYAGQKQIILSTHSDYVLDHVRPENVYQVTFEKHRGTEARHIQSTMTRKEFAALREYLDRVGNLGEYWREGGLGDRS
jgi:energy-coupling factor transporter ATP-binding protein EcfA2